MGGSESEAFRASISFWGFGARIIIFLFVAAGFRDVGRGVSCSFRRISCVSVCLEGLLWIFLFVRRLPIPCVFYDHRFLSAYRTPTDPPRESFFGEPRHDSDDSARGIPWGLG